mmetsp:Transcript_11596/g.43559  ORF Transcript_11596/g.43559 Transcript_11596/m.43559 type:complete len:109 (-) Transcript_11596:646-972(-)
MSQDGGTLEVLNSILLLSAIEFQVTPGVHGKCFQNIVLCYEELQTAISIIPPEPLPPLRMQLSPASPTIPHALCSTAPSRASPHSKHSSTQSLHIRQTQSSSGRDNNQ